MTLKEPAFPKHISSKKSGLSPKINICENETLEELAFPKHVLSKKICENETLKELAFPKHILPKKSGVCPKNNLWKWDFKGTSFPRTRFVQEMRPFSKKNCENETLKELAFPKHILSKKSGFSQRVQK